MLRAQNMAPKEQAAFRADTALLARIDAFAASIMGEYPGLNVSRTDAIVMLLTEALNARGIGGGAPAKKGAKKARKP